MEQEWDNGLCDHVCGASDFKSCMGAWCCNCFMFGRVAQRLEKFPSTNKDNMPLFNGMCGLMCLADYVHLFWVPVWMKRTELRRKFNIKGNGCEDCLVSYFCHCCAIGQMDTELKQRAQTQTSHAAGKEAQYAPNPSQMAYQSNV